MAYFTNIDDYSKEILTCINCGKKQAISMIEDDSGKEEEGPYCEQCWKKWFKENILIWFTKNVL